MKKNYVKNTIKFGVAAIVFLAFGVANAQQTTGDITQNIPNGVNTPGSVIPTVRVVDNKGTIKYLQSINGITMLTNTTNNQTTTTWQLGGKLTSNTEIDFNGQTFSFATVLQQTGAQATTADDSGTGYTLLTRDEGTGNIKKLLITDLVKSGSTNGTATAATDFTYTDATVPNDISKIWVYRNGAKLLGGVDYTIAGTVGAVTVTVKEASGTAPEDYTFFTGDRIEIQWIE